MNPYLTAFLRSIFEAITEFLPVSSTGHLLLFSAFFPFYGENVECYDRFEKSIPGGAFISFLFLYIEKKHIKHTFTPPLFTITLKTKLPHQKLNSLM
ncbi:undecaprenyl-diphosphate phosphatase [Leptospira interrogans serovar Pomona]|nr:undecaprenyl-diphosphate phosphatase [Leptospira interrogans serovar Pomona]